MESKTVALRMQSDSEEAKLFGQLCMKILNHDVFQKLNTKPIFLDPTYQVPVVYFIL